MSILLPFPTPQGANLADNDAGNGINAPPLGAPEFMATDTYNDVDRYDKTSIKQNTENVLAINAALGTMAEQDASAVAITGGNIDAAVSVALAVDSTLFGGFSIQQWYDFAHPIDSVQMMNVESAPPIPAGVSATWVLEAESFYLKGITTGQTPGETFGGGTQQTDPTALSEAELPAHTHNLIANENTAVSTLPGPTDPIARELNSAGDASYRLTAGTITPTRGESSSVGSGAGHTHGFESIPPTYRIAIYRRTA